MPTKLMLAGMHILRNGWLKVRFVKVLLNMAAIEGVFQKPVQRPRLKTRPSEQILRSHVALQPAFWIPQGGRQWTMGV